MKNKALALISLFSSTSTLLCCALPATFVVLGFGATFAGLVRDVPQLVWLSENKSILFAFSGTMLLVSGALQWQSRRLPCPVDPTLARDCSTTKDWSLRLYWLSLFLFLVGAFFAFIAPMLLG